MSTTLGNARGAAIAEYDVLGNDELDGLHDLVVLAAQLCDTPAAIVNLIDAERQHSVATAGVSRSVCDAEDSFCARTLELNGPVMVPDASVDPRFADSPYATGELDNIKFYAASPLRTPAGVVIGTLCVYDTVSRTIAPEKLAALDALARRAVDVLELRRNARELARSNEQLAAFAGQVSHDLRNPLTGIRGFLEVALDEPHLADQPAVRQPLERAWKSAQRMTTMVDDLLKYAALGSQLRRDRVHLGDVCKDALADLSAQTARTQATITTGFLPVVTGDRTQLRAVLQNLLANALKFTRPGQSPIVHISAAQVGDQWRVTVDDRGPGVPEKLREAVFGLLERGEKDDVPGTGIGLATCARIIEAHGGRTGIADSTGGGASVWFTLPTDSDDRATA